MNLDYQTRKKESTIVTPLVKVTKEMSLNREAISNSNTYAHETNNSLQSYLKSEVKSLDRKNTFHSYLLWYLIGRKVPIGDTSFLDGLSNALERFAEISRYDYSDLLEEFQRDYIDRHCPDRSFYQVKGNVVKVDFRKV